MAEMKHSTPYSIPLTSNSTPTPFAATASTSEWGAWRAFSESLADDWAPTGMSESKSHWVQVKLDKTIRIWGFKIAVRTTITAQDSGQVPYHFKVHGSQDGVNFTEICAYTEAPKEWFVVYDTEKKIYDWSSPQMVEVAAETVEYLYYRFEFFNCQTIDKNNTTTSTQVDNVKPTRIQLFQVEGTAVEYTVTFLDWDNTTLKTESVIAGGNATAPSNPSRDGYVFTGWDTAFTNVQADLTVGALYVKQHNVRFLDWNGIVLKTEFVISGGNAAAPPNPAREGYTFVGWDTPFTNVQSDLTVTALYDSIASIFTVKFLDWDNTVLKTQTVRQGDPAMPPLPPVRKGYIFDHWSENFTDIQTNMQITAVYLAEHKWVAIKIFYKNALVQTIPKVISASLRDSLKGERSFEFTTLVDRGSSIKTGGVAEFEGCYFNIVRVSKSISSDIMVIAVTCEHISNVLNEEMYDIENFDFTGTPTAGLEKLLKGTQLLPGTVEYTNTVTMKINKKATRRAALMQYVAILGGEIEYSGSKINIRKHRGKSTVKELLDSKNITNVSVVNDIRSKSESYDVEFYKKVDCSIGDEVHIRFSPLGINTQTRIIAMEYNPFYSYNIRMEVGNYRPTINDSLYQLEKKTNSSKDKIDKVESNYDSIKKDYDNFKETYKEVKNLVVEENTFSVTFTDESTAVYSFTVDSAGRITGINKSG